MKEREKERWKGKEGEQEVKGRMRKKQKRKVFAETSFNGDAGAPSIALNEKGERRIMNKARGGGSKERNRMIKEGDRLAR